MATKKRGGRGIALGALAAAAAGAAAGYYFYASEDAKKHRKIAAKWASDMKKDVVREAKKLKNIDRTKLASIVDEAASAYTAAKNVDRKDLARAAKELKAHWKLLAEELPGASAGKKAARRGSKVKGPRKTR